MNNLFPSLFLILLSSCASFHAEKIKMNDHFSSSDLQNAKSVNVKINHEYFDNHLGVARYYKHYPYPFNGIREMQSFRVCAINPCPVKDDRTILIDLYFGRSSDITALLSGLTLTLFPAKETEIFYIKAFVLDADDKTLKFYEFGDEIAVWYQLFFLFAMPFRESDMKDKVARNMINEVLLRAKRDGFL